MQVSQVINLDPIPDSVQCKLYRAKEHFIELQAEVGRYYKTNPAKIVRQQEGSPDEYIGKVVTDSPVPKRIPLIIGDVLQNLRSSLDYLVWELVIAAKNTPNHNNMFPICTSETTFKDAIARRLQGVGAKAIDEIDALQPYHDGADREGHVLALLDKLTNINKHRQILNTVLASFNAPKDFVAHDINGESFAEISFDSVLKQDTKIGPFPIVDGAVKMDMPLKLIAFVAFQDGIVQDVEVSRALDIFMGFVIQELPNFDQFFV